MRSSPEFSIPPLFVAATWQRRCDLAQSVRGIDSAADIMPHGSGRIQRGAMPFPAPAARNHCHVQTFTY
jgi:hypothetical protein